MRRKDVIASTENHAQMSIKQLSKYQTCVEIANCYRQEPVPQVYINNVAMVRVIARTC